MGLGIVGQAVGLFAVTNIDDLVVLSLLFAQAANRRGAATKIVLGQYLGFSAILAVAVAAAYGASFLPPKAVAYLGLVPIALGIRAAWKHGKADEEEPPVLGIWAIAGVTLANGGDDIGVYVPVFATAGLGATAVYVIVFLVLVAVWCLAGRLLVAHPAVATRASRWAHVLLPVVLIALGLLILIDGGAFQLS